jgi:hypothetical protein
MAQEREREREQAGASDVRNEGRRDIETATHLRDANRPVAVLVEEAEGLAELADSVLGQLDRPARHGVGGAMLLSRVVYFSGVWSSAGRKGE